jgi:hypothetical protein
MQDVVSKQFCQSSRMNLHNIKPVQLAVLATIFGRKTSTGEEVPEWPIALGETARPKQIDFEATALAFRPPRANMT